ncbi:MAG: PepSY1/2 domain-containing protein [Bacillota bacterium]
MERRRDILRWSLIALLAVAVGLGIPWVAKQHLALTRAQAALRASRQMAYSGFLTQVENLEVLLAKALASSARDRQIMLLSRIAAEADGAGLNLAQLPSAGHDLGVAQKFLKQVSGYCQILAQQLVRGQPLSPDQRNILADLHNLAGQVAQAMHSAGRPTTSSPGAAHAQAAEQGTTEGAPSPEVIRSWLQAAARQLESFPGLVYDGPFSEHLEQLKPTPLPGAPVNATQAATLARAFLGLGPEVRLAGVSAVTGPVPAYSVRFRPAGTNREIVVDVSQAGGHILWMLDQRTVGTPTIDRARALHVATDFLRTRGFPPAVVTGWLREGDQLTFSFAPLLRPDGSLPDWPADTGAPAPAGTIVMYRQTIKVRVGLDTGRISGLDAVAYWQQSGVRKLPQPRFAPDEAAALVNPGMKVQRVSLALIPIGADREVLTYEVQASMGGQDGAPGDVFLIYYNVESGREEAIFQLQENETVRLAM